MQGILISAKPITNLSKPYLLLQRSDGKIEKFELNRDQAITITKTNPSEKFCVGWYDIGEHTNHPCPNNSQVDEKYESCFVCRSKTNFNPAFYNTANVSAEQLIYNQSPHTVYIAYFGNKIAKAGIMSDSRGLTRLYEQGALLYTIVGSYPNADEARKREKQLVDLGLKESVRKNQKESIFSTPVEQDEQRKNFLEILDKLNLGKRPSVQSNLNTYFFGSYPKKDIKKLSSYKPISGAVKGTVGGYLVLENSDRFYGLWLSNLYGYQISISNQVALIKPEPEQIGLF